MQISKTRLNQHLKKNQTENWKRCTHANTERLFQETHLEIHFIVILLSLHNNVTSQLHHLQHFSSLSFWKDSCTIVILGLFVQ